jgi:type VI secretion system Hcp family effector
MQSDNGKKIGPFDVISIKLGGSSGTGSGGSKTPKHGTVVVTKEVDSASPLLLQAHVTAEVFKTVQFKLYRSGASVPYTVYSLTDAIISGVQTTGISGVQTETMTLNFTKLTITGAT